MKKIKRYFLSFFIMIFSITNTYGGERTTSPYNLGEKWQVYNMFLELFGDPQNPNMHLKSYLKEMIIQNSNHFGGACDVYELPYRAIETTEIEIAGGSVGYDDIYFKTKINTDYSDVYCKDHYDLQTPYFIKNVTRMALLTKICYEIMHDESDKYSAQEYLKNIMCPNGCSRKMFTKNIKNLYRHFYPYRIMDNFIGGLNNWGIGGFTRDPDTAIKILGTAFCMDPHWSHF